MSDVSAGAADGGGDADDSAGTVLAVAGSVVLGCATSAVWHARRINENTTLLARMIMDIEPAIAAQPVPLPFEAAVSSVRDQPA